MVVVVSRGPIGMCPAVDERKGRCANIPGHDGKHGNIYGWWLPDRPGRVPAPRQSLDGPLCARGCCRIRGHATTAAPNPTPGGAA